MSFVTRFIGRPKTWMVAIVVVVGLSAAGGGQGGANEADQAAGDPDERMNFLELLLKGGWFMVPIAACSLLGLTFIIERALALRRSKITPPGFLSGLGAVFRTPRDAEAALHYCRDHPAPVARVIAVGIRKMPQGVEAVEQGIEDAGANEVAKLRRNLKLLFGVASVAPMLGLLGTVWGMIVAFETAAIEGFGGGQGAQNMAAGIYEALVTTLAGLCVAIPILVFYYYFQGKIERIVTDLNDICEQFVEQYMVESSPSAQPARPSPPPVAPPYPPQPAAQPHPAT